MKGNKKKVEKCFDVGRSWEEGKGSQYTKDVCLRMTSSSMVEKGTNYIIVFFLKRKQKEESQV